MIEPMDSGSSWKKYDLEEGWFIIVYDNDTGLVINRNKHDYYSITKKSMRMLRDIFKAQQDR
jgi:hypothetical protein